LKFPPGVDPVAIRVAQLERDVGILLELIQEIGDEAVRVASKSGWRAHAAAMQRLLTSLDEPQPMSAMDATAAPLAEPVATPQAEPKPPRAKRRSRPEQVMANMHYDKWLSVGDIAKGAGVKTHVVQVTLTGLKKATLVDNQERKWRLRAPTRVNGTHLNRSSGQAHL
jgi:hypothetical protein